MSAFDHGRHDDGPGPVRKLIAALLTVIFVVGTLAFSAVLLAAATGHLDTLKNLFGL